MISTINNNKKMRNSLILNCSSTKHCSSRDKGLCPFWEDCYGNEIEGRPNVARDRMNREILFTHEPTFMIVDSLILDWKNKKEKPIAVRFNESGDFQDQWAVDKMTEILLGFREWLDDIKADIPFYGYTKRHDLDYADLSEIATLNSYYELNAPHNLYLPIYISEFKELPEDAIKCGCALSTKVDGVCDNCTYCKELQDSAIYTVIENKRDRQEILSFKREMMVV